MPLAVLLHRIKGKFRVEGSSAGDLSSAPHSKQCLPVQYNIQSIFERHCEHRLQNLSVKLFQSLMILVFNFFFKREKKI